MEPRRRSVGVRTYVISLMMAVLLPTTLFAAAMLTYLWATQRDQLRERHQASVANLSSVVAARLQDSANRLELLAASRPYRDAPADAMTAVARDVFLARAPEWSGVLMLEVPSGRPLLSLAAPNRPAPPGSGDLPHRRAAVASGRPLVSPLFTHGEGGRPQVEVVVPVRTGDVVTHLLAAALDLDALGRELAVYVKPTDVAVIVDGTHRIITRTRDGAKFVGHTTVPELDARMRREPHGWGRFITFEGDAVYTAWAPAGQWGWAVAYGLSAAPIEQALTRSLGLLALMGVIVVALGLAFALLASRRIVNAINGAASSAELAAIGRLPPQAYSGVVELDALHRSLRDAARRVAAEAADRSHAERERDRLIDAERSARARAEAESRSKDEFLATLGHELRNPLAAIVNAAHVLRDALRGNARAELPVEIIVRQSAQQQRLLDDLLDVARVTTGKLVLRRAPHDLAACVHSALGTLAAGGRTARHRVVASLDEAWVDADATRVEQIVVNLVGNAVKFTPAGGTIEVSTRREGGDAVLRVRDTGIGIEPALLPRVFDLFVQHDGTPDRIAGGLGIGLTLVQRVAALHGGTVAAASAGRGLGAEFTVRLPLLAERSAGAPGAILPLARERSRDILIVEDNPDVRAMLRSALETEGHRVRVCGSGREALDAAFAHPPEAAIVDIGLPDLGGVEVARALRERFGGAIRLVGVTGYGTIDDPEHAFDARLVKPVDAAELARIVDRLCAPGVEAD